MCLLFTDEIAENPEKHNIEKKVSSEKNEDSLVHFSEKSVEIGDGKFGSALEFRIPSPKQSADEKNVSIGLTIEGEIEPTTVDTKMKVCKACNNDDASVNETDAVQEETLKSKELSREEFSNCLRDSIKEENQDSNVNANKEVLVIEEIEKIE